MTLGSSLVLLLAIQDGAPLEVTVCAGGDLERHWKERDKHDKTDKDAQICLVYLAREPIGEIFDTKRFPNKHAENAMVYGQLARKLKGRLRVVLDVDAEVDLTHIVILTNICQDSGVQLEIKGGPPPGKIDHDSPDERKRALLRLSGIADPTSFDTIAKLLEDPDASVRLEAAHALRTMGASRAVTPLSAWLRKEDSTERYVALLAMLQLDGTRDHLKTALAHLDDPDQGLQILSRHCVAAWGGPENASRLLGPFPADVDVPVILASSTALVRIGRPEDVKNLRALMDLIPANSVIAEGFHSQMILLQGILGARVLKANEKAALAQELAPFKEVVSVLTRLAAAIARVRLGAENREKQAAILEEIVSNPSLVQHMGPALCDALMSVHEPEAFATLTRREPLDAPLERSADFRALVKKRGLVLDDSTVLIRWGRLEKGAAAYDLLTAWHLLSVAREHSIPYVEKGSLRMLTVDDSLNAWRVRLK